ncbi:MAG TPA: DsbA family protein [Caulobacteraceae bacterium]|jgi:protein-disulfide isomerase|nr:DsbA family protein [Caulobacteraceae bacterium]
MPLILPSRRLVLLGASATALAACHKGGAAGALPDDMSLGNPNSKVTVIEYASVACPVCGRWFKEVWPAFKAKYVDSGKVHYIFREMLVGNTDEVTAAASGFLLARCAGRDRYFNIVDAVFNSQPELFNDPRGVLLNIAKSSGLTEDQFNACVGNEDALNALNKRVQANGQKDDVQATPTFVVNGTKLEPGYRPLSDLDAAIAKAQGS